MRHTREYGVGVPVFGGKSVIEANKRAIIGDVNLRVKEVPHARGEIADGVDGFEGISLTNVLQPTARELEEPV